MADAERLSLPHLNDAGVARMVDVGAKQPTRRVAIAQGMVRCDAATLELVVAGGLAKGDVFGAARIAGILAAKRTPDLIPLCHPLQLDAVSVDVMPDPEGAGLRIRAEISCTGRTGVEMEALTAVVVAALTVVDMLKSADRWCVVDGVGLVSKSGGRSGALERPGDRPLAG